MTVADRKYRRGAPQPRCRAKTLSWECEESASMSELDKTPHSSSGGANNIAQDLFAAISPAGQTKSSYREQLRASGQQALDSVHARGQSSKGTPKNNSATSKQLARTRVSAPARTQPAAPVEPRPSMIDRPYVGWHETNCNPGSPFWPASPTDSTVSGNSPTNLRDLQVSRTPQTPQTPHTPQAPQAPQVLPMPQTPPSQHAELMAIAMPQAMNFGWDGELIAAQLRAAMPASYED